MIAIIAASFLIAGAAEMGDKSQLMAFALANRFKRPGAVMAGILTATLLNHGLAAWGGAWISTRIAPPVLRIALAILFIGFGVWISIPDRKASAESADRFGPYLTTTFSYFLAEIGDKTQLATIALAARYHSYLGVTIGSTLGILASDGFAVFLGEEIFRRIPVRRVRRAASLLFVFFGALTLSK